VHYTGSLQQITDREQQHDDGDAAGFSASRARPMDTKTTPFWCTWAAVLYELPNGRLNSWAPSEDEVKSAHAEVNDLQRRYRREYELPMVRR
jgi:hypothetical protein